MYMPKRNAAKTRENIMKTAERLFAKKGFDATSVDSIAKAAKVNKALIYYYFKNKQDIIHSIFDNMQEEMRGDRRSSGVEEGLLIDKVMHEKAFLLGRKSTLSLLLMESLKENSDGSFLFQIAKKEIETELGRRGFVQNSDDPEEKAKFQAALVHEFFTGILPLISVVILQGKFSKFFDMEEEMVEMLFRQAFESSHLSSHIEPK